MRHYFKRLVPASEAMMTVTPSHTQPGQLPLGACQTATGSAKPVKALNFYGVNSFKCFCHSLSWRTVKNDMLLMEVCLFNSSDCGRRALLWGERRPTHIRPWGQTAPSYGLGDAFQSRCRSRSRDGYRCHERFRLEDSFSHCAERRFLSGHE